MAENKLGMWGEQKRYKHFVGIHVPSDGHSHKLDLQSPQHLTEFVEELGAATSSKLSMVVTKLECYYVFHFFPK